MWSPQITGVELAGPGSGNRQARLSALSNLVGRFFSSQTPLLCGPRHCGQLSARAEVEIGALTVRARTTRPARKLRIMSTSPDKKNRRSTAASIDFGVRAGSGQGMPPEPHGPMASGHRGSLFLLLATTGFHELGKS